MSAASSGKGLDQELACVDSEQVKDAVNGVVYQLMANPDTQYTLRAPTEATNLSSLF